jgi:hypothetical protein
MCGPRNQVPICRAAEEYCCACEDDPGESGTVHAALTSHVARWSGGASAAPRSACADPPHPSRTRGCAARPPALRTWRRLPRRRRKRKGADMTTDDPHDPGAPALLARVLLWPGAADRAIALRRARGGRRHAGRAVRRNGAQHRPRRPRPNRRGVRFGGDGILDHPRHDHGGRGLPRGVRTAF